MHQNVSWSSFFPLLAPWCSSVRVHYVVDWFVLWSEATGTNATANT